VRPLLGGLQPRRFDAIAIQQDFQQAANVDEDLIGTLMRLRRDPAAGPDAIQPVLEALRDERLRRAEPGLPVREIRVGGRPLGDAVPVLREFLRDAEMDVVFWACQILGWLEAREALPDLLDLLRPEAPAERRIAIPFVFEDWGLSYPDESAMYALELMKAVETVPILVATCLASESARTRHTASQTLRAMRAVPQVALRLADADERVRSAVETFLCDPYVVVGALRPEVEAALLSVLQGPAVDARSACVRVLGRLASVRTG
jgi:HEAT repeat protein